MFVIAVLAILLAQEPADNAARPDFQPPVHTLSASEILEFKAKAQAGDAAAQLSLGLAYEKGNGVPEDDIAAAAWYRKAADQGNAVAQNNLGIMYRMGSGVPKDKEEAVKWYRKAARQKNPNAMFNLGTAYYNGDGVPINDVLAYAWFLLAEEAGSVSAKDAVQRATTDGPVVPMDAFFYIAQMYEKGTDFDTNAREAAKWYAKGAAHGHGASTIRLAWMYISGVGVNQDYGQAMLLCKGVRPELYTPGAYCLATLYKEGWGVPPDSREALKWYRKSADGEMIEAMLPVATMYWKGEGTKSDRVEAYFWFFRAAVGGVPDAKTQAAAVLKEMSDKEKKKLRGRLQQYRVNPEKVFSYMATAPAS